MARMTSRLEKKERKKIIKQTALFLGIAVVVGLLFIFLILPNFIRILTTFFSSGDSFVTTDTLPPQMPVISTPPDATSSATLVLSGFAEPSSEVFVLLDGQIDKQVSVSQDGTFSVQVQLAQGENVLTTYSEDAAKNQSPSTKAFQVVFDQTPPSLVVLTPQPDLRVEGARNQTIQITGESDPDARVLLNDKSIFPKSDGTFASSFFLNEGENKLVFVAIDPAGNEITQELTVTFVR